MSTCGGAADAAGRLLTLNGIPHRIAGVLPEGFDDPLESGVDIWTPIDLQPGENNSWQNYYLSAIARLKPGATIAQAQAELATIAAAMEWNNDASASVRVSARVTPLQADTVGSAGAMLWILLGAVGVLLVIACVNVASLFLARGAARETELAVRAALGCSRWRLVRQLLVESVLLSLAGGGAGLLLAQAVTAVLLAAAPEAVARAGGAALERSVFTFSFGIAMLAGIGFRRRAGAPDQPAGSRSDAARVWPRRQCEPPSDAGAKPARGLSDRAGARAPRRRRPAPRELRATAVGRSWRPRVERPHVRSAPAVGPL